MTNNAIELSITQVVKNYLSIEDDVEPTKLYDLLFNYRNSFHPDKYPDSKKKEVEVKFKESNELLSKLGIFTKEAKLEKKGSEILKVQDDFKIFEYQNTVIEKDEIIYELYEKINVLNKENDKLKSEINIMKSDKVNEKSLELISKYEPKKSNYIKWGITVILSILLIVFSKVDDIAKILKNYWFFGETKFNYFILFIFLITLIFILKKYFELNKIKYLSNLVCTTSFIKGIPNYYDFNEDVIFEYIRNNLIPKKIIKKFIFTKIFKIYDENTIESLKNIFIYNLLSKDLISISNPSRLVRTFTINS